MQYLFRLIKQTMKTLLTFFSLTALCISSLAPTGALAESVDSKGTDFWLTFPDNGGGRLAQFSFFLSSPTETKVKIEIPGTAFQAEVSVEADVALKYVLPAEVEALENDIAENIGIHLSADSEFTVYGLSRLKESTDAYLALPSDVIGTEYVVLAWDKTPNPLFSSQYAVVVTTDNTVVTITASELDPCGEDTEVTLNAGDVYQHLSCNGGDVTGTTLSATAPISVFAGHECANIPNANYRYCDHIIEQIPSIGTWGKSFITAPLATRTKGDTFRVLAGAEGAVVNIAGTEITLNSGEYYETSLTFASTIESDRPILVAQYSKGTEFDGVTSDPFMMLVPPFEQFLDDYTFAAPTEGFRVNYVNVVVKESLISSLRLDGASIDAVDFSSIGETGFSYAQIAIAPGSHTLKGAVAGVFVYGYDDYDSYGYAGGLSLSEVALVDSVDLLPNFDLVEGEVCFKARVVDVLDRAISDIRVDFIVELIEGSDRTNTNGIATFCVEAGENPSEFKVTASVGSDTTESVIVKSKDRGSDGASNSSGGSGGTTSISLLLMLTLLISRRFIK